MIDCLLELSDGMKIIFTFVFMAIAIICSVEYTNQVESFNVINRLYKYIPCDVRIVQTIISPIEKNVSSQILTMQCFHTYNHANELEIGNPPTVNNLLWIGIIFGFLGFLLGMYINKSN